MRFKLTALFLALLALVSVQFASAADPPRKPAKLTREQAEFAARLMAAAKANNVFAWALWPRLMDPKTPANVLYSAPSLSQSLAMAAAGTAGPTRDELWSAMGFNPRSEPLAVYAGLLQAFQKSQTSKSQFTIANAIWVSKETPLKPEYIKGMETLLAAKAQNVDFSRVDEVIATINGWVKTNTNGKIATLVSRDHITPETFVVLTNTVYFKADWETGFGLVSSGRFHVGLEQAETVDMMSASFACNYAASDAYQMIELPYKGNKTVFRVILPVINHNQKTPPILTSQALDNLLNNARPTKVHITLPKFKLEYEQDMIPALKALKVKQAFMPGADFSPMLIKPRPDLYVSFVLQKTVIEVNESGTVAAAASASGGTIFGPSSAPPDPTPVFIANRPFNFQIVDRETNSILFMGFLANPGPAHAPEPTATR